MNRFHAKNNFKKINWIRDRKIKKITRFLILILRFSYTVGVYSKVLNKIFTACAGILFKSSDASLRSCTCAVFP
jgi:uncharacterized membrane protein